MRIVLFANNWVGLKVTQFLRQQHEDIVLLAIHEPDKQTYTKEIIQASGNTADTIVHAHQLREPATIARIKQIAPDFILSAFWAYILKPDIIEAPKRGTINFHPAYLPFNRGMHPNVWPFLEGTPAGVTIHYIDRGIDTGDVIAREIVPIHPLDTAETLYNKTLVRIVELFCRQWPKIKKNKAGRVRQDLLRHHPTFHKRVDMDREDVIDLAKTYTGWEFINRLRARSYSDRYYAYYVDNSVKVSVRLQIQPAYKESGQAAVYTKNAPKRRKEAMLLKTTLSRVKVAQWPHAPSTVLHRLPNGKHLEMYCLTREVGYLPETIRLLSTWRSRHANWFPSRFRVTQQGTRRWLDTQVFDVPDRILFLLRIAGLSAPFGHIGLNRYNAAEGSIEIDNVVRGFDAPHSRGAMTAAMSMLEQWVREHLPIRRLSLRVFGDNKAALALYARSGYVPVEEIPLRRVLSGGLVSWIEDATVKNPKRIFVRMVKNIV